MRPPILALATFCILHFSFFISSRASASVTIVRDGKPAAVIIIPDNPVESVRYAADELVWHIEKSTGAKLQIIPESQFRPTDASHAHIHLGETRSVRFVGIDTSKLPPESFVLRPVKIAWRACAPAESLPKSTVSHGATSGLVIAGRDAPGDPLNANTSAGTLFGVYELLQRHIGVVWAWPGELGTCVPKKQTLSLATIPANPENKSVAPPFMQRHARHGTSFKFDNHALGFTPKAADDYAEAQKVFLRRNRMGRAEQFSYGHAFTKWWEKYGDKHPEWFQLVNGKRGTAQRNKRYSMCVSNPRFQQEVVNDWLRKTKGKSNYLNAVENDILGLCECDNCRAWDGPEPADSMKFYAPNFKVYGSRFVSDRYAKFTLAVQQLAAKHNPDVNVIQYAYFNYFQAPTSGVKLNKNILIGFCPSAGWYPRSPDEHEWHKEAWRGWREAGARLFMRTNYFLDGYNMPFIFARQFADDFQFAARNGMVATDFDTLTGHWATQGTTLYLLMTLHTRPLADVDALLAEYYSVFGPAADHVKAYFDYWENFTMSNRGRIHDIFADRVAIRWRSWAKAAHRVFRESDFAPAEKILADAARAAAADPESLARVRFLQTGLQHARLGAKVCALLTTADETSTPERGSAALTELLRFRRAHEREWISNLGHLGWVEDVSWKLSAETKQEPDYYP